jgi:hypothetical protein
MKQKGFSRVALAEFCAENEQSAEPDRAQRFVK